MVASASAFSSVNLKLLRDASETEVIKRLDALIDRYGGQAAYGRRDQTSHAYLDHELEMLKNMSRAATNFSFGGGISDQCHAQPDCCART
jgi:hypothetical protein